MYCSDCGAKAAGSFCSQCGARLATLEPAAQALDQDWQHEIRYAVLLHFPEVRDLLAQHAARMSKGLSGEAFLDLCEKVYEPVPGVSLSTLAGILAPLYARMGIRTGKVRTEYLPAPAGRVLVAVLCSLAGHGRTITGVHQGEDGCVLEAVLPSDFRSFEGQFIVSVRRHGPEAQVEAATRIPGQLFDWGKSRQCLHQLFEDLPRLIHPSRVA
jgi:hypothetical protein